MSRQDYYIKMKELWIYNIKKNFNDLNNVFIDIYFLYDAEDNIQLHLDNIYEDTNLNIYDFYIDTKTKIYINSTIKRSLWFFEYLNSNKYFNADYIIRSNASTVFNFKLFIEWTFNKPKTNFFAGSIISNCLNPLLLSGTNLVFTKDLIEDIIKHKKTLNMNIIDDVCFSLFIYSIKHLKNIYSINIKRIDFIGHILYHKCHVNDKNIFCFKFKSNDRYNDIKYMKTLIDENFKINFLEKEFEIKSEYSEYDELYSRKIFKIL